MGQQDCNNDKKTTRKTVRSNDGHTGNSMGRPIQLGSAHSSRKMRRGTIPNVVTLGGVQWSGTKAIDLVVLGSLLLILAYVMYVATDL